MRKRQTKLQPMPARHAEVGSVGVLVAAARSQMLAGRLDAAEDLLRRAVSAEPSDAAAHDCMAILQMMRGQFALAVESARKAVNQAGGHASHYFTLGRAHKAAGDLDEAITAYRRAIAMDPRYAEPHVSLGIALKAQGDLEAAITCYRTALEINPNLAVAHSNLGAAMALLDERRARAAKEDVLPSEEMIAAQQRAVALSKNDPDLLRNLGVLLMRAGRLEQAVHAFNESLGLNPSDAQCCAHLGSCLVDLGRHSIARDVYEKWLNTNAKDAGMMRALSNSMTLLGAADAGLEWALRAYVIEPDPITGMQIGSTLMQLRRLQEGLNRCRETIDASGRNVILYPLLLLGLNYLHEDPEPILTAHEEFGSLLALPVNRPAPRRLVAGQRLRIGYVSGDFVRHSVAFFVAPLLKNHDKTGFEVICYHSNARTDGVTEQLKACGHQWVECAHMSDNALFRRIREDGIDILIDLAGLTASSRALLFAMAPAPVQLAYLGYPTITGIGAMDYRITDAAIDPGDIRRLRCEEALHLPHSMFCYQPPGDAPIPADPPCLRNGHLTFGSFNNIAKVTDHTLTLWASVMRACPGSRLLLKAGAMSQASNRANIVAFMATCGIDADRIRLQDRDADDRHHLSLYNEVDIALDTFPYNGATTTCEALWMGVPVISLRGRTHTSRMGASLLGAIGRSDWVADSDEDFVVRAAAMAGDANGLASWRRGARSHLEASPLLDHAGFARDFEAVLEKAWALSAARA